MAQAQRQPIAGYPTKGAAAWGLHKLGKSNEEIATLTGSTPDAVKTAIRMARIKAGEPAPPRGKHSKRELANQHQPDASPGKWTVEKKAKVRRLYGLTLIEIAKAVQVKPAELLTYVIHGIEPGTRTIGADGAIAWRDDEQLQIAPPAASIVHAAALDALEAAGREIAGLSPKNETDTPPYSGQEPDFVDVEPEPDRDDDEAELARLAAEEGTSPAVTEALQEIAGTKAQSGRIESAIQVREVAPPAPRFQPTPAPAGPVANPVAGGTRLPTSGLFPAGRMVRLVREDGQYLHEGLDGFTKDVTYAWDGPRQQYDAVKAQMPRIVAKLMFEVVP